MNEPDNEEIDDIQRILESVAQDVEAIKPGSAELGQFFDSRIWKTIVASARREVAACYLGTADVAHNSNEARVFQAGRIHGLRWMLDFEGNMKTKLETERGDG